MLYSLYMEFSDFDRLFLCFCRFLINIKKYLKMTEDCSTSSGKENWYRSPSVYSVCVVFDFWETICGNLWTPPQTSYPPVPAFVKFYLHVSFSGSVLQYGSFCFSLRLFLPAMRPSVQYGIARFLFPPVLRSAVLHILYASENTKITEKQKIFFFLGILSKNEVILCG